jgi:integrase
VESLKRGRSQARETTAVKRVPDDMLQATLGAITNQNIRDMVQVQLLTGVRPGELCSMRPQEIARSGDIWTYTPATA